jgi:hypothetical protein
MKYPIRNILTAISVVFIVLSITIGTSMATSPCVQMITSVEIKLKSNDVLRGYIIWSPYDAVGWNEVVWRIYKKNAEESLFTEKIYVIKSGKFIEKYFTKEESTRIKSKDIQNIRLIKLQHDGYVSQIGITSIPLVMAKYSDANEPVAYFCKDDDSVKYGWIGCVISFNKAYTKKVIKKEFYKLIKKPEKYLTENNLILVEYCND